MLQRLRSHKLQRDEIECSFYGSLFGVGNESEYNFRVYHRAIDPGATVW